MKVDMISIEFNGDQILADLHALVMCVCQPHCAAWQQWRDERVALRSGSALCVFAPENALAMRAGPCPIFKNHFFSVRFFSFASWARRAAHACAIFTILGSESCA